MTGDSRFPDGEILTLGQLVCRFDQTQIGAERSFLPGYCTDRLPTVPPASYGSAKGDEGCVSPRSQPRSLLPFANGL